MAARNKHFEKNTQTFSQKGSSLPKAVQIKVAARLLEELKAAEPAESGEETLPLDGAEWLGWLRIPSLELELPVQVETLAPTAVDEMTGGDWDLTLFTCTYSGQARVTVRCVKTTG